MCNGMLIMLYISMSGFLCVLLTFKGCDGLDETLATLSVLGLKNNEITGFFVSCVQYRHLLH